MHSLQMSKKENKERILLPFYITQTEYSDATTTSKFLCSFHKEYLLS